MSKYDPLTQLLRAHDACEIWLSFNQIGDLIDGDLPDSAYGHRPWWANRTDGKGSQSLAWQSVGWETRDVDMSREVVRFVKVKPAIEAQNPNNGGRKLSIAEAKEGLATNFGVPVDAIEINIRG